MFGTYLAVRRCRAGLGLRAVAQGLGISHSYLADVETGKRPPLDERHWAPLIGTVSGITEDGLVWARASTLQTISVAGLSRQERFAVAELLHRLREGRELPEEFEPAEAQEQYRDRTLIDEAPTVVDGIREVLGDAAMSAADIADTLVALGWRPRATNLEAYVRYLLGQHPDSFARAGKLYRQVARPQVPSERRDRRR